MSQARYIMIGGFLGAGKTTSVARLAERLTAQGRRVGLITNDQGTELVDTAMLPSVAAAVIGGTSIFGGRGGYSGTIVGALILTVISSILSSLGYPEAVRQMLFGGLIVLVAAAYTRITGD